jgi:hypothetical protein
MFPEDVNFSVIVEIVQASHAPSVSSLATLNFDRTGEGGSVHVPDRQGAVFVLPKKIGQVEVVNNVPEDAIAAAMAEIRQASRG